MAYTKMTLDFANPAGIGLDTQRLEAAKELLFRGLENGEYTCAVWLVARHGKVAVWEAIGRLGDEENDPPAKPDSIFDMASVTKPVATATSLMILVERGALHLNQPVTDFFPNRKLPHLSGVTVKHLATHTSGLPAWRDLFSEDGTREGAIERLLQTPLENQPGKKHVYSCLGYITLGLVIEQAAGMPLKEFARKNIFEPLGMVDSCFNPPAEKSGRIARTANSRGRDRVLCGEVHDENAHAMQGNSGNAGLFSTASDIATYAQMLINGGWVRQSDKQEEARILCPLSVRKMLTNQINPEISGQSIGFFTPPNEMTPCGDLFSERCAGHTGFTGTSLLIDPEYDMFVILLTNRVYKKREAPDFLRRRRLFHNIIASAVR
ncbi:MAG: beta-lactamase family protein [Armatimonadetes bacterium]|nr:beta-lactamase family protein [Armatimonadota bacterium]